jgi:hypothetical protein
MRRIAMHPEPARRFDLALDADPDPGLDPDRSELELRLRLRDPEMIEELAAIADPRERVEHATTALRIGLLALRSARGQVDAGAVRTQVDRMLLALEKNLDQHRDRLQHELATALRGYFDPKEGRFEERVQALVKDDGEIARVIRAHVAGSDSALAATLSQHVGPESALLRTLDPTNTQGLVAGMQRLVEDALAAQRRTLLGEFSLDNADGALARFIAELGKNQGQLGAALDERVGQIVRELTLDSETGALARIRRELLGAVERMDRSQAEMKVEIAKFVATREARSRTTAHGSDFEAALLRWLERRAQESGDVCEEVGNRTGAIASCKVGDAVVELGPEHRAAGARIVFEAKEDAGYRLPKAREEIEQARKNRSAEVGVFVLSAQSAGDGWERFRAVGNDVFVVWDANDPESDVLLEVVYSLARTLCVRARASHETAVDFADFERAIRSVEKQIDGLAEIQKSANTIENGAERIRERARIMENHLLRAVETLDACRDAAHRELAGPAAGAA